MEELQNTLRDTIEQNFEEVIEAPTETESSPDRPRDESGRFAAKPEEVAEVVVQPPVEPPAPVKTRPSSWKKEYEEHWSALGSDPKLSALQDYILKRESDYATGVSTYKQEADRAKELNEAFAPLMGDLQKYNVTPAQWIQDAAGVHRTLLNGQPHERLAVIHKMINDYGIDISPLINGQQVQANPEINYLRNQLQQLTTDITSFKSAQQQAEDRQVREVYEAFASDVEKHPHLELVKEDMAQLLESGLAPDLETAYQKAVRMNDSAWEAEIARKQQADESQRQAAATKARAHAVSPKTATPSGVVSTGKKDRASLLSEAFDSHTERRV